MKVTEAEPRGINEVCARLVPVTHEAERGTEEGAWGTKSEDGTIGPSEEVTAAETNPRAQP